jgi:hydrogenase maturation protease
MLIIGCGNRQRSDDAAGILVAEKLRELGIKADTCAGQSADLLEAWAGADDVIVVDVVVTGAPVGTVRAWDARQVLISLKAPASTHGLGLAEAIELARVLGRLPARLQVYGIEGQRFGEGSEISPELHSGIEEVVRRILEAVSETRTVGQPNLSARHRDTAELLRPNKAERSKTAFTG